MNPRIIAILIGISTTAFVAPNRAPAPVAGEGSVRGDVIVFTAYADGGREANVLMLVDEQLDDRMPDGRVDRVFRLQAKAGAVDPVNLHLIGAEVAWTRGAVTAVTHDRDRVLTLVAAHASDRDYAGSVVRGFGLSHSARWKVSVPSRELTPDDYDDLRTKLMSLQEIVCPCRAQGGSGCSYSCGGETCSVTCNAPKTGCCGCADDGKPCCYCRAPE
jgi:hypothetical protein